MPKIEMDTSADEARRKLLAYGDIGQPGPQLLRDTVRVLEGVKELLEGDPNADQDDLHPLVDREYSASTYVKDTPEVFDLDDEGLAGPNPSAGDKVSASIYALLSGIASSALNENRPDITEVDWDEANTPRGHVLVGRHPDEGFIFVEAALRTRHEDQPHQNNQDQRLVLSLTGTVRDGGGQITMHLDSGFEPAPGWTNEEVERLWAIWDRWHMNGTNAACVHQRRIAERLGKRPGEVFTTRNARVDEAGRDYGRGVDGKQPSNARVHCMICDYDYGSAWLFDELPDDVVEFIDAKFPAARSIPR